MQTVLIIGGSGTVGSHLLAEIARQRLEQRMHILCAARSDTAANKVRSQGLTPIYLDLDDHAGVRRVIKGVATIVMVMPYTLRMLNYAKSVVDAASAAKARRIINLSAFGPDESVIDLLTWHRLVDRYIASSGLAFTHLRPGFFMEGLTARFDPVAAIVSDLSGGQRVPWVAAADIARVAAAILDDPDGHAGKAYPLVSEIISASDIARLLGTLMDKRIGVVATDQSKAIDALIARGREPAFARAIIEYAAVAAGFTRKEAFSTIEAIAGDPPISVRAFLEDKLKVKASQASS